MDGTLVVSAAIAPLHAEPRAGSEQVSQRLSGHQLDVLEVRSPWLQVRGADGYTGWTHSGYVRSLSPREAQARYRGRRVSLGCTVLEADGARRPLPLGAILADDARVERGSALEPAELARRFPRTPEAIARSAAELFEGTPYQWGGTTPWGADCSGLVQSVFALHGLSLPRDSRQQAREGSAAEGGLGALRPADLLFFSDREDGAITHVAMALGPMRIVHLALGRGGFALEDLGASDDPYVAALVARFRFARRMEIGG